MDAGEITSLIHLDTGLSAYTAQDFRKLTMNYILHNTGIPIGFGVSSVLAFVVGMAIAGQTFLQFALQNERYLAAFKAMGIATSVLIRMLLVQSLFVAIVSFGIGAGSAALVGLIVGPGGRLPYYMPWQLVAISFAAVLVLCVVSTTLSIFRVKAPGSCHGVSNMTQEIAIKFESVSKDFRSGENTVHALQAISLTLSGGRMAMITGPSGKTTLLSVISGMLRPSSGTVHVLGSRIDQVDEQNKTSFSRTILGSSFSSFIWFPQ